VIPAITPAMRARGLRDTAAEEEWVRVCVRGNDYAPEVAETMIAHRMAQHATRCAWAEVEYAARRAGNCVGMIPTSAPRSLMRRLVDAAYAAERAEHDAAVRWRTAETHAEHARFRERTPWPTTTPT
jgi:hypothetical protein